MHAGSWKKGLSYRDLATELVDYVKQEGYTHVEFMPLAQQSAPDPGPPGSPGYYAVDSRLGAPTICYLVDKFHQAGIGVIMDWVPAHFPKDAFALGRFDGTPLYEDPDPLRGEHPDWGTYVFNFGRREVRNFLVANALFWLEDLHVDALRVDAVSSMLYLDYSRANPVSGARTSTEAGAEPGGHRLPQGGHRHRLQEQPRRDDDRRGIHRMAGHHRPHFRRRHRLRTQVEHGLDASHP